MQMTAINRREGHVNLFTRVSLFAGIVEHIRQRRLIAKLHELDDHRLWDIGVDRSEIEDVIRNGRRPGRR